jgi:FkbM family methyltransferase
VTQEKQGAKPALPSTVQSVYGPVLIADYGDTTFELSVRGRYGNLIPKTLAAIDRPFVFLDIGANAGIFSLVADTLPRCLAVFAFEPVPATFARLVGNIWKNNARKIVPVCAAVSDTEEPIVRLSYNPNHSGASSIKPNGNVIAPTVGSKFLDTLVAGSTPVALKVDVEGGEAHVLRAVFAAAFRPRICDLVVEVSKRMVGADTIADLLAMLDREGFEEIARSGKDDHYDAHYRPRAR